MVLQYKNPAIVIQKNWRMFKERTKFRQHSQKTKIQDSYNNPVSSVELFNIFLLKVYHYKSASPGTLIDEFNRVFYTHFHLFDAPINSIDQLFEYVLSSKFKTLMDRLQYEGGKKIQKLTEKEKKQDNEFSLKAKLREEKPDEEASSTIAGITDPSYTPKQFIGFFKTGNIRAIDKYTFAHSEKPSLLFFNAKRIPLVGHVSGTSLFFLNYLIKFNEDTHNFNENTKELCLFIFIWRGIGGHHDLLECIYALEMRQKSRQLFSIDIPILKASSDEVYHTLIRKVLNTYFPAYPEYLELFNQAFDEYYNTTTLDLSVRPEDDENQNISYP